MLKLFVVESFILKDGWLKPNRSCTVYSIQRTETRRVRMQGTCSIKILYEILLFLSKYNHNFSIFQMKLRSANHYDLLWEIPSSSFWMHMHWTDQYVTFMLSHTNSKAGPSQDSESTLAGNIFFIDDKLLSYSQRWL